MSEFSIQALKSLGASGSVDGRCYSGTLRVGNVFLTAIGPDATSQTVRLTIVRMETYQREMRELDEGLTAKLHLQGEGWTHLGVGTVLRTHDDAENEI